MSTIKRAILSCYDKTGIVEFARFLQDLDVELISTSGTLKKLEEGGVKATHISEFTGVREMLEGRVKSLHPKVHSGLLGVRDSKLHQEQMQEYDYEWIDLVVTNMHPLDDVKAKPGIGLDEIVDQIDIGGTAMVRSGAKNFRYVTVVVNPERYSTIMHEMRAHDGGVTFATRYRMAQEAFAVTAEYDRAIADLLLDAEPPKE